MKKFFRENALTLSMVAFLLLVFIFGMIMLSLFLPDFSKSKYGNRLDGIEDYVISDAEIKKLDDTMLNSGFDATYTTNLEGKLYTVVITLNEYKTKEEMVTFANNLIINSFTVKNRGFYSFEVFINYDDKNKTDEVDNSYVLDGYLKNGKTTISFNKY